MARKPDPVMKYRFAETMINISGWQGRAPAPSSIEWALSAVEGAQALSPPPLKVLPALIQVPRRRAPGWCETHRHHHHCSAIGLRRRANGQFAWRLA